MTTIPFIGTPVITGVRLQDSTVMQSFAQARVGGDWVTAQVMQDNRFGQTHDFHAEHGDLTLTHMSTDGKRILSWMYLHGFGHGQSFSVQLAHPGFWIYTEAVSIQGPTSTTDGFGTSIARFKWAARHSILPTSEEVDIYNPHPGTFHNSPSVNGSQIAVRYMTADKRLHVSIHDLADFLAHNYTPITTIDLPRMHGTNQGWTLLPMMRIASLTGDPYSDSNPDPGDTILTVLDVNGIVELVPVMEARSLVWREPEGVHAEGDNVLNGFASGQAGARRANIYRRTLP